MDTARTITQLLTDQIFRDGLGLPPTTHIEAGQVAGVLFDVLQSILIIIHFHKKEHWMQLE